MMEDLWTPKFTQSCGVCRNAGDDRQPSAGAERSTPVRPIASRPVRPELTFRSRPQVGLCSLWLGLRERLAWAELTLCGLHKDTCEMHVTPSESILPHTLCMRSPMAFRLSRTIYATDIYASGWLVSSGGAPTRCWPCIRGPAGISGAWVSLLQRLMHACVCCSRSSW